MFLPTPVDEACENTRSSSSRVISFDGELTIRPSFSFLVRVTGGVPDSGEIASTATMAEIATAAIIPPIIALFNDFCSSKRE